MTAMEDLEDVAAYVNEAGETTAPAVAEEFGHSNRSARRRLHRLMDEDRVEREDDNAGGYIYRPKGGDETPETGIDAPEEPGEPAPTDTRPLLTGSLREYLQHGTLNGDPEGKALIKLVDCIEAYTLGTPFGKRADPEDIRLVADRLGMEVNDNLSPRLLIDGVEGLLAECSLPVRSLFDDRDTISGSDARRIRTALDITQAAAAEAADRDPAAVSRWEREEDNIGHEANERIKRFLKREYERRRGRKAVSPEWRLPDPWSRDTDARRLAWVHEDGLRLEVTPEGATSLQDAEDPDPNTGDRYTLKARDPEGEYAGDLLDHGGSRSDVIDRAMELVTEYTDRPVPVEEFSTFIVRECRCSNCGGRTLVLGVNDPEKDLKCPHCPEMNPLSAYEEMESAILDAHPGDVDPLDDIEDHTVVHRPA